MSRHGRRTGEERTPSSTGPWSWGSPEWVSVIYHVKKLQGHETLETLKRYVRLMIVDLRDTHSKRHPRERDG